MLAFNSARFFETISGVAFSLTKESLIKSLLVIFYGKKYFTLLKDGNLKIGNFINLYKHFWNINHEADQSKYVDVQCQVLHQKQLPTDHQGRRIEDHRHGVQSGIHREANPETGLASSVPDHLDIRG